MATKKVQLLIIAIAVLVSFVSGGLAFPVLVRNVAPISSSEIFVPSAKALVINNVQWLIDPSDSTLSAVFLNVTNVEPDTHTFFIVVQVSCATSFSSGSGNPFIQSYTCASGGVQVTLSGGQNTLIQLTFSKTVDPEQNQIEDLSFIVNQLS